MNFILKTEKKVYLRVMGHLTMRLLMLNSSTEAEGSGVMGMVVKCQLENHSDLPKPRSDNIQTPPSPSCQRRNEAIMEI